MKRQLHALFMLSFLTSIYSFGQNAYSNNSLQKSIVTANMDSSMKPGDNFYIFVNGKWTKNILMPPTQAELGTFHDVNELTEKHLHSILDSVGRGGFEMGSIEQKVGDFYASGMDSARIESLGYDPIKPYLQQINGLIDIKSIMNFEARMHTIGQSYLVALGVFADAKNSSMNILLAAQTGLGLLDRDYYFRNDAATVPIQKAYQVYIRKTFMLLGDDSTTAMKKSEAIYTLEKEIATSHRTNVEKRDPQSNYNKMTVAELDKKTPNIGWPLFLNNIELKTDSIDVAQPAYYMKLDELLKKIPIDTWKAYYTFHVSDEASTSLSSTFVNAHFDYNKLLNGRKEIDPRWKRISRETDDNLRDALGELYVKRYFTDDAKKRMLDLVNNLLSAFEARIKKVDWMSDSTKKMAVEKLHAFIKKIGYPDKWRDYSKLTIDRNKYFDNLVSCAINNNQRYLSRLGKPVDRSEWWMSAPAVNAYYLPSFNEIVFPAGILQPPLFDPDADDAANYGAIGTMIGHEMTHGFDSRGGQYDKDGNLKNWWGKKDSAEFVARTKLIIQQFDGYTMLDTLHVNGALTTGENIADLGGLNIAYDAFKLTKEGRDTTKIDGFNSDQRFFISFAQFWRSKLTDKLIRVRIYADPHSPAIWRVNGPLSNFTPFYTAFNVQPDDKMYKPESERLKIW
jgi:putative endopeptidase